MEDERAEVIKGLEDIRTSLEKLYDLCSLIFHLITLSIQYRFSYH